VLWCQEFVLGLEVSYNNSVPVRRFLLFALILILLVLDWAALDDITTGNEQNYFLEYAVLLISLLIFGILGLVIFRRKQKQKLRNSKRD